MDPAEPQSTAEPTAPLPAGWRERVALPAFGIKRIKAKLDTGARTSAIVARQIEYFKRDGEPWVRFVVYPRRRRRKPAVTCEAPIVDTRLVRSSTGHNVSRTVIRTELLVAGVSWPIEVTLARRAKLRYRMLLGREALAGRLTVDSGRSYLLGKDPASAPVPRRTT